MLPNVRNRYKRIGKSCGLIAQTDRVPGIDAAWPNPAKSKFIYRWGGITAKISDDECFVCRTFFDFNS